MCRVATANFRVLDPSHVHADSTCVLMLIVTGSESVSFPEAESVTLSRAPINVEIGVLESGEHADDALRETRRYTVDEIQRLREKKESSKFFTARTRLHG